MRLGDKKDNLGTGLDIKFATNTLISIKWKMVHFVGKHFIVEGDFLLIVFVLFKFPPITTTTNLSIINFFKLFACLFLFAC